MLAKEPNTDKPQQPLMDHRTNAAIAEEHGIVALPPKPYIPRPAFQKALKRGETQGKNHPVFTPEDGIHFKRMSLWERARRIAHKARELTGFAKQDQKALEAATSELELKRQQRAEWDEALRKRSQDLGRLPGKAGDPNAQRSHVRKAHER